MHTDGGRVVHERGVDGSERRLGGGATSAGSDDVVEDGRQLLEEVHRRIAETRAF